MVRTIEIVIPIDPSFLEWRSRHILTDKKVFKPVMRSNFETLSFLHKTAEELLFFKSLIVLVCHAEVKRKVNMEPRFSFCLLCLNEKVEVQERCQI